MNENNKKSNNKVKTLHPFEVARLFGSIPLGEVDYFTAKTIYHTPGFKEKKQKEMDEYLKKYERTRN